MRLCKHHPWRNPSRLGNLHQLRSQLMLKGIEPRNDRKQTTLWTISNGEHDGETVHGTQKPVECMRRPMLNNSSTGDFVFEPFSGSGTTLIAAETIDRICLAMELEPTYVDLALRRWQQFTGQDALRERDGRRFNELSQEFDSTAEGDHR